MNDDENMWLVTFYAEWCPYCQPFSPELEAAQVDPALGDKKIKFGAVDVMQSRDITQRYAIQRSPTIKIFGRDKNAPMDYSGHRSRFELVNFANNYALANEYVIPPEVGIAEHWYNIESIVKEIAEAHATRIKAAHAAQEEALGETKSNGV